MNQHIIRDSMNIKCDGRGGLRLRRQVKKAYQKVDTLNCAKTTSAKKKETNILREYTKTKGTKKKWALTMTG